MSPPTNFMYLRTTAALHLAFCTRQPAPGSLHSLASEGPAEGPAASLGGAAGLFGGGLKAVSLNSPSASAGRGGHGFQSIMFVGITPHPITCKVVG